MPLACVLRSRSRLETGVSPGRSAEPETVNAVATGYRYGTVLEEKASLAACAIVLHANLCGLIYRVPNSLASDRVYLLVVAQSGKGFALPEYREVALEAADIIVKRKRNSGDIPIVPGVAPSVSN